MSDSTNTTPPKIDWEKAKKPVIFGLLLIALLIILLLSRCDGVRNGASTAVGWFSWGDDEVTETNLIVPDGCEILTMEDGVKKVVCSEECLTEEDFRAIYTDLLCNPPECEPPVSSETVTPPPPPPPVPSSSRNSCEALAKKTGQPWQCLDPRRYRNYRGNQIKHGLCPGRLKCMIPGTRGSGPPRPPDEPTAELEEVTFFIKGRDCRTFYLTNFDHPNVRILTPGARRDPNDPRKIILPPGTREIRVEYPVNIPVEIYNMEGPDGNWSAQHGNARIVGSQEGGLQEQTTPEFTVGFTRRGRTHVATPADSIKNEDWGYRGEVAPPTKGGGTSSPGGGLTFDANN